MDETTDTRRPSRRHAVTMFYAAVALMVIVAALLVYRLEAGLDPAIGSTARTPDVQQQRVIVEEWVDPAEDATTSGGPQTEPQTRES